MPEKQPIFFHSDRATDLSMGIAFTNSLLGDVDINVKSLPQSRVKIK